MKNTVQNIILYFSSELNGQYPETEIQSFYFLIFDHLLGYTRIDVHQHKNDSISPETIAQIKYIVSELKKFRPIQQIFGKTEFYDLPFIVNEHVLIPRQETEEIVHLIIKEYKNQTPKILDIGTGSGCIAISLAKNIAGSQVYACDVSKDALKTAKENAKKNKVNIRFFYADILNYKKYLPQEKFDIIISNPPYVTNKEKELMSPNVLDYEPHLALFVPDENPLLFYKIITGLAPDYLSDKGKVFFEINEAFGNETTALFNKENFKSTVILKDINGKDRFVKAEK